MSQTLTTKPAVEVKLSDVIKVLNKPGAYRFLVIDKKYSNDKDVIDALMTSYGINEITINK